MLALSVEMVLKAAYFRFIGYAPTRTIDKVDLRDAEGDIHNLGVSELSQGFHNLIFWAEALISARRSGLPNRLHGGRSYAAAPASPLQAADEASLRQCATRLATNWDIGDRYKSLEPHASKKDLEDVLDDSVAIIYLYEQGRV